MSGYFVFHYLSRSCHFLCQSTQIKYSAYQASYHPPRSSASHRWTFLGIPARQWSHRGSCSIGVGVHTAHLLSSKDSAPSFWIHSLWRCSSWVSPCVHPSCCPLGAWFEWTFRSWSSTPPSSWPIWWDHISIWRQIASERRCSFIGGWVGCLSHRSELGSESTLMG